MALTVSQVSKLAGVSVRTLHHYDEIGLLSPSARSDAGYRLYEQKDLDRLQQVLFFRELGFPLEDVRRLMEEPGFDVRTALELQRQLLTERVVRTRTLIDAVEKAIEALDGARVMTNEERFEVFGEFNPEQYEAEAQQRWGDTDAYRESARRTKRYGKKEWQQIKDEGEANSLRLAELMTAGKPPASPEAMDAAEATRQHISRWFYPCAPQFHRALGEMYVADSRFTANIDKVRPGLARYWRDAIHANADRQLQRVGREVLSEELGARDEAPAERAPREHGRKARR